MNKKVFFFLIPHIIATNVFCQVNFPLEKKAFNKDSISFFLKQADKTITYPSTYSKKALVIVFLSPECPLCKNYSVKLANIKTKYEEQVEFIGIIPGTFDENKITEFQKNYLSSWELFSDKYLRLTHYLEGKVTPEVLVINSKDGRLIYKGAIDDWLVSLGKPRTHPSNFYLDTALYNFLNNKHAIAFTKPVGCLINDF
jgi:thiol-disulfide isomerase/thioredoxin